MVVFMSSEDSDIASNRSSPLPQVVCKFTPEPERPPFSYNRIIPTAETSDNENGPAHHRSRRARRKQKGSQGDFVLLNFLDPNQIEVATAAIRSPIHSRSTTEEAHDLEDDMSTSQVEGPLVAHLPPFSFHADLRNGPLARHTDSVMNYGRLSPKPSPPEIFRQTSSNGPYPPDGRYERQDYSSTQYRDHPTRQDYNQRSPPTFRSISQSETYRQTETHAVDGLLRLKHRPQLGNLNLPDPALATSPGLQPLLIKPSQRSPQSLLPAWRPEVASPKAETYLPPVSQLLRNTESSSSRSRARTTSISSSQSTSTAAPALPNNPFAQSRSPQRTIPPLAQSPITTRSEMSPSEYAAKFSPASAKSAPAQIFNPSQPSPRPSYSQSLQVRDQFTSASSTSGASTSSTEAYTPISDRTSSERQASIEVSVIPARLSTPAASRSQNYGSYSVSAGGYKCKFEGCTAPPFTTQYLLNSHANVHSSERPHFCPVEGCPRGIGGLGFKRKNEMKRHGLVHNSPGYVCPFCPDREHRYPRPDNLQRHVRLHHEDRHLNDPQLRDVLAQRPAGDRPRGTPRSRRGGAINRVAGGE